MSACYPKNKYDYEKIQLQCIYSHHNLPSFPQAPVQTESSRKVFGELRFPVCPKDRVYTMACFVTSIDGKVAFPDNPAGPVVAQANSCDPDGADADFWSLNLFRANADVVIGGARTMQEEPDGVVCLFDQELEDERLRKSMPPAPWMVINSLDGRDIPFGDSLIRNQPVIFHTSPAGQEVIEKGIRDLKDPYVIGPYPSAEAAAADGEEIGRHFRELSGEKIPVIITGRDNSTDSASLLCILRLFGFQRALVESPSYFHVLLQESLLDEALLNTSGVYIGGQAVGLGQGLQPCTAERHPHAELLSLHMHSPFFIYSRYRFFTGGSGPADCRLLSKHLQYF